MDGIAVPQVELPQQPEAPKVKRRTGLVVAILIAVLAVGGFAYAVVWSGGLDQVRSLVGPYLGLASQSQSSAKSPGASGTTTGKPPVKSSEMPAVVLPSWAQATMYDEQLTSQAGITSVVNNEVEGFVFSKPIVAENGVQVPLKATFRDGRTHSGTISLLEAKGGWFFAGLDTGVAKKVPDTPFDESVTSVITKEQSLPSSQEALKAFSDGTITGMDMVSVVPGTNTAGLNVVLHGGAYEGRQGRFVCIKKVDGLDDYWFVTGFTWK